MFGRLVGPVDEGAQVTVEDDRQPSFDLPVPSKQGTQARQMAAE